MPSYWRQQQPTVPVIPVAKGPPPQPSYNPLPTGPVTAPTPTPAPVPAYSPLPGGGGGGGGGTTRTPTTTGAPTGDLGPFKSVDEWAAQFEREHGRPPNLQTRRTAAGQESNDWLDFQDSVNFYRQTGRGPTAKEWKNRYYTGYWWPDNRGYGGGGGGGGGYGNQQSLGTQYPEDMGIYWWNTR